MKQVNRFTISGLVAVAAAIGLAACGERADAPDRVGQQGGGDSSMTQSDRSTDQRPGGAVAGGGLMGGGAGPAAAASDDASISAAVLAALAQETQLQSVRVEVEVAAGKVTLKGSAPDAATRDMAGEIVASVQGVTAVENQIRVAAS